jgi:hypothetical protein
VSKQDFYTDSYLNTGWLPMQPLTYRVAIGDICQIRQGRLSRIIPLSDWRLSLGVQQSFSEARFAEGEGGERYCHTRQVLEFAHADNFMFHANEVSAQLLLNWNQIRDDLTLKLTQLHYGFREAYVVTCVATMNEWGLVVAGQSGARLEMSAAIDSTDRFLLLSHRSAKADQCHGIANYDLGRGQAAHFFKAKKLIISDEMHDRYLCQVVENSAHLRQSDVASWLDANLLDLAKNNELNLNSCMKYFSWVDISLDDVTLLAG